MVPAGYVACAIAERTDLTDDLAVFKLQFDEPPVFVPGQYITLAIEGCNALVRRAYSIVSAPHEPLLELFIERVEEGELTPRLWDLAPGDTLLARKKIVGHFTLDTDHGLTRHIFASTVTGVAPFLSMARHQIHALETGALDTPHQMLLLHGASHFSELKHYASELSALAEAHPWLTYVPTVSRPWENDGWTGEVGRVEDVVRKHADALGFTARTAVAYACGNPDMIDTVHGILRRAGFPKDRLRDEKYFTLKDEKVQVTRTVTVEETVTVPAPAPRPAPRTPPPGFAPRAVATGTRPATLPPRSDSSV